MKVVKNSQIQLFARQSYISDWKLSIIIHKAYWRQETDLYLTLSIAAQPCVTMKQVDNGMSKLEIGWIMNTN